MVQIKAKLATSINSTFIPEIRDLALSEGKELQSLVDEAFADLIEKRKQHQPRTTIMFAYQKSHEHFSSLYKKLAE